MSFVPLERLAAQAGRDRRHDRPWPAGGVE